MHDDQNGAIDERGWRAKQSGQEREYGIHVDTNGFGTKKKLQRRNEILVTFHRRIDDVLWAGPSPKQGMMPKVGPSRQLPVTKFDLSETASGNQIDQKIKNKRDQIRPSSCR